MATSRLFRFCVCQSAGLFLLAGCALPSGSSLFSRFDRNSDRPQIVRHVPASSHANGDGEVKDPAKIHLAYARLQEEVGNLVKARESYETALGEEPKSVDAILGLARLDQMAERTGQAEQRYLRAMRLQPNDPKVLNAFGQFYVAEGRWTEAQQMLNAAMMAAPNDPKHRFDLAVAMVHAGNVAGAMPHFARSVGEAEGHYNVGYILQRKGNLAAAQKQYELALAKKPSLAQAHAMLDRIRGQLPQNTMLADTAGSQSQSAQSRGTTASTDFPTQRPQSYPRVNPASRIAEAAHTWPVQQASVAAPVINPGATQPAAWHGGQSASPPTSWQEVPTWQPNAVQPASTPSYYSDSHSGTSSNNGYTGGTPQRRVSIQTWTEKIPPYQPEQFQSAGASSPEPNDGLTPAQREQLQNQNNSSNRR